MQAQRTIIEATKDGSLLITREARVGVGGTSQSRRKARRVGVKETWRFIDRVIAPNALSIPAKAINWAGLTNLQETDTNAELAAENDRVARRFVNRVRQLIADNLRAQESFVIQPATMGKSDDYLLRSFNQ